MNTDSQRSERDLSHALTQAFGRLPTFSSEALKGDASSRRYYRLRLDDRTDDEPTTLVVMELPPGDFRSDEGSSGPIPKELPFLNLQRFLARRGVPVPRIYGKDLEQGVVLLEDLGTETFEGRLLERDPSQWESLYERAVDLLADMHDRCAAPDPDCLAFSRCFDQPLLRWELEHFAEWGLEAPHGPLDANDRAILSRFFDGLAEELAAVPARFVHRDFQSRNLMWRGDDLVVIDFQDALLGPEPYDLVALLCDSYVNLDEGLQERMIGRYSGARGIDPKPFRALFWKVALQRKLKDAGRFVFIDRVRGNPDFLRWYAPTFLSIGRALRAQEGTDEVASILGRSIGGFPHHVNTPERATGTARPE